MRLIFRAVLPLLVGVALTGCNMVVSEQPWFSDTDTQGAPSLRGGLWVRLDGSEQCQVKLEQPADYWPDCAGPVVVREREWREPNWKGKEKGKKRFAGWQPIPVVLAAGEPPIIQVIQQGETGDKAYYIYLGTRSLATGDDGRVYALAMWLVQCGPLERNATDAGEGVNKNVTLRPFAGLTVKDDNCTAESREALRNAARRSEGLGLEPGEILTTMRWVRESWP